MESTFLFNDDQVEDNPFDLWWIHTPLCFLMIQYLGIDDTFLMLTYNYYIRKLVIGKIYIAKISNNQQKLVTISSYRICLINQLNFAIKLKSIKRSFCISYK